MSADSIYSFVFKGLLTDQALDATGRIPKKNFNSTEDEYRQIEDSLGILDMDADIVHNAKKMSIVYKAIASFENTVRLFIAKKLLEHHGENWWLECVSERIRKTADARREEESKFRWHTPRGDNIINYIDFSDLASIMRQNFPLFEPHISSIEWVDLIFKSLERSRNVIMHSGEIANQDIERIGTFIRDWLNQVGS